MKRHCANMQHSSRQLLSRFRQISKTICSGCFTAILLSVLASLTPSHNIKAVAAEILSSQNAHESVITLIDHLTPEAETHLIDSDFEKAQLLLAAANAGDQTQKNRHEITSEKGSGQIRQEELLRPDLFEGDIAGIEKLEFRNGLRSAQQLWPVPTRIPYTISSQYSPNARSIIAAAMEEYSRLTCVTFVPKTTESDYLFIKPDDGCFSFIGRIGGVQVVSLGIGCLGKGTVEHELMHAIGFLHEHSRPDRDEFVDIKWENVIQSGQQQFQKYDAHMVNMLNQPYDYGSVMHYGPYYFSKNSKPTMVPKRTGVQIGQRIQFSQGDIAKINALYKCPNAMFQQTNNINRAAAAWERPRPSAVVRRSSEVAVPSGAHLNCRDENPSCPQLRLLAYCVTQPHYMRQYCAATCSFCTNRYYNYYDASSYQRVEQQSDLRIARTYAEDAAAKTAENNCRDKQMFCYELVQKGYCLHVAHKKYMATNCRHSCKLC